MATLDSLADGAERVDESGPSAPRKPVVATSVRLYTIGERSTVLVHEGEEVPRRLVGLPYVPAVLDPEAGAYVPKPRERPRR